MIIMLFHGVVHPDNATHWPLEAEPHRCSLTSAGCSLGHSPFVLLYELFLSMHPVTNHFIFVVPASTLGVAHLLMFGAGKTRTSLEYLPSPFTFAHQFLCISLLLPALIFFQEWPKFTWHTGNERYFLLAIFIICNVTHQNHSRLPQDPASPHPTPSRLQPLCTSNLKHHSDFP